MPWLPLIVDGDPAFDREGRPKVVCHTGAHRLNATNPGPCSCPVLPCPYRGRVLSSAGCCGAPIATILACDVMGACTLESEGANLLEWKGEPVKACETCDKRPR